MTDATNQDDLVQFVDDVVDGVDDDQTNDQVDDQGDGDEGDADDADQSTDDDLEDFEEDGKTYKVPKDLKGHLLRNQDYTRKTQALAEQRKALEAEIAKVQSDNEEIADAKISLRQVQSRQKALEDLTEADWSQIRAMDAQDGGNRYDKLQREFLTLPREADRIKQTLDQKVSEASRKQQEISAKQVEEGQAILARDIPGWGPELGAKLVKFVKDEFGVDESNPKHSAAFMDPALVKMAHAAFKAKESQRKTATAQKAQNATQNPPPKTAKSAAPVTGLSDNLSAAEWAKRRNEEVAKRRA